MQRPLWASTGTKNPALSPVLYIEELAGKDTVNTTPPATLKALLQNMTVEPRLHKGLDEAKKVIAGLEGFGLNFSQLVHDLQVDGVRLFAEAYADLVASIETKKKAV